MSVWPAAVRACADLPTPKFKPAADVAGFDPNQRLQILDEHLPVPRALPDAKALLEMGKFNFGLDVKGTDIFVGVGRKGRSFLDEVSRHFEIKPEQMIGEDDLDGRTFANERVLIVDDAIHTGRTLVDVVGKLKVRGAGSIRALVVLASEDGLAHVRVKVPGVDVRHVLLVPEQYYTGTYQRSVGPAMAHYQAGSLSNRPCKIVYAEAANYDASRAALDVLRVLSNWDAAESFGQTPLGDGDQSPIFRGTIDFGPEMDARVRSWNGGQDYEQVKARVFIDARDHLTIHANGIYYPITDGPLTEAQLQDLEDSVCAPMLDALATHLRDGLLALGYSVNLPSLT